MDSITQTVIGKSTMLWSVIAIGLVLSPVIPASPVEGLIPGGAARGPEPYFIYTEEGVIFSVPEGTTSEIHCIQTAHQSEPFHSITLSGYGFALLHHGCYVQTLREGSHPLPINNVAHQVKHDVHVRQPTKLEPTQEDEDPTRWKVPIVVLALVAGTSLLSIVCTCVTYVKYWEQQALAEHRARLMTRLIQRLRVLARHPAADLSRPPKSPNCRLGPNPNDVDSYFQVLHE